MLNHFHLPIEKTSAWQKKKNCIGRTQTMKTEAGDLEKLLQQKTKRVGQPHPSEIHNVSSINAVTEEPPEVLD